MRQKDGRYAYEEFLFLGLVMKDEHSGKSAHGSAKDGKPYESSLAHPEFSCFCKSLVYAVDGKRDEIYRQKIQ